MPNIYELTCLISSQQEETERNKTAEEVGVFIKEKGGKITAMTPPGPVNLGYPIKGETKGYMVIFAFEHDGQKITEIKNSLEKRNDILRCFLVKKPKAPQAPPSPTREQLHQDRKIKKAEESPEQQTVKTGKADLKDIDKKLEEIFNPKKNT